MRTVWEGGDVKWETGQVGRGGEGKKGRKGKGWRRGKEGKKGRRKGIDVDGDGKEVLCVGWHKQIEWKRRQKLLNLRIKEGGERGDRDKHR